MVILLAFRMRTAAVLAVALLCACLATYGQTDSLSRGENPTPGFSALMLNKPVPGNYTNIAAIDLRNRTLTLYDKNNKADQKAPLKHGAYEHRYIHFYRMVTLDNVYYLPSQNPESQFALALYTWFESSGSSSQDGIAEVYELQAHHLKLVQQFSWDEQYGEDPYVAYSETTKILTVKSAHELDFDAHCCVSAVDVVTLQWNGQRLVKKSVSMELTKYGRENGKRLPN